METESFSHKYSQLFLSTFKLSACTFGGGFVIIPLMRKKFVEELCWIEEHEMMDLTAIAQSSPGAIAVNASILVGYKVAGLAGALLTVLGTVLPPLIIVSVISLFYQTFRDNPFVNMAMNGMLAGVAAVICDVVLKMVKEINAQKRLLPVVVLAGSFIATRYLNISIVYIILICGLIGATDTYCKEHNLTVNYHSIVYLLEEFACHKRTLVPVVVGLFILSSYIITPVTGVVVLIVSGFGALLIYNYEKGKRNHIK